MKRFNPNDDHINKKTDFLKLNIEDGKSTIEVYYKLICRKHIFSEVVVKKDGMTAILSFIEYRIECEFIRPQVHDNIIVLFGVSFIHMLKVKYQEDSNFQLIIRKLDSNDIDDPYKSLKMRMNSFTTKSLDENNILINLRNQN